MSKLFCEICGTAYSDTASQCPICGCPKPETADFDTDPSTESTESRGAAPVRGGRFSKSNVNKRVKAAAAVDPDSDERPVRRKKKSSSGAERGLIITIVLLLVAIAIVVGYIVITYFLPRSSGDDAPESTPSTTQTTPPTTIPPLQTVPPTTEPQIRPCTALKLSEESIRFNQEGATWLLNVIPTPANTTDTITFTSSDTNVATVSADGKVTAVGDGECIITIVCGDIAIECNVTCALAPTPTVPDETTPGETQPGETEPVADEDFKLNREDFTIAVGESWLLYNGPIDVSKITWTSSNTSVATVVNGRVRGVGVGHCWITAEYNGVKLKCIVYVT